MMLVGAFILLGHALYVALVDSTVPEWATMATNFLGYGFLVAGFGIKMRQPKAGAGKTEGPGPGAEEP